MTTPTLSDAERLTAYEVLVADTGPFSCGFHIYQSGTDASAMIEVYLDGEQQVGNWTLTSTGGGADLSILPRPITDGVITFTSNITGELIIVGAARPRQASQFNNGQSITADQHNQRYTNIMAMLREQFDLKSRLIRTRPGETVDVLPTVADRASLFAAYDADGNLVAADGFVAGTSTPAVASAITNDSGVAGAGVAAALNTLNSELTTAEAAITALQAGLVPMGQCRLAYTNATTLTLSRYKGKFLWVDGANREVPSGGLTVTNSGLSTSTLYYIYATRSGSAVNALEASATAPTTHTDGTQIKTGDSTRALVGKARTNGSSQFIGGTYGAPIAVYSWHNPERLLRVEQILIGSSPGTGIDVADSSSAYVYMTGTTANTLSSYPLVGTARIRYATVRFVVASNNTGNKIKLIHFDDGPLNETDIQEYTTTSSGTPVNENFNITSALQALQDGIVNKNFGVKVLCVNGSVYTVYKVVMEIVFDLDPW